jgi:hypothetical protein
MRRLAPTRLGSPSGPAIKRFVTVLLAGPLLVMGSLALPQSSRATTPEEAIALANRQRATYGIPPLTLDQSLLKPECNLADHEIASPTTKWTPTSSPWDGAPWHEATLFNPEAVAGSYGEYPFDGQSSIWACMWFGYSWQDESFDGQEEVIFAPPTQERHFTFYWASEASGPADVPPSVFANELPHSPAEEAGLPNPTGPNLIVYAVTPGLPFLATAKEATVMTTSDEKLPVHVVAGDRNDAVVLIDKPVSPSSTFSVKVQWEGNSYGTGPTAATQTFDFKTGTKSTAEKAEVPGPGLVNLRLTVHGSRFRLGAPSIVLGHRVQISVDRIWVPCALLRSDHRCTWVQKGHAITYRRKISRGLGLRFRPPGPWEKTVITATTPGFDRKGREYLPGDTSITVAGPKPKHAAR